MLNRRTLLKLKKLLCTCLCLFVFLVVFGFLYQTNSDPFVGSTAKTPAIETIDMNELALNIKSNLLSDVNSLRDYVIQDPTFNANSEST